MLRLTLRLGVPALAGVAAWAVCAAMASAQLIGGGYPPTALAPTARINNWAINAASFNRGWNNMYHTYGANPYAQAAFGAALNQLANPTLPPVVASPYVPAVTPYAPPYYPPYYGGAAAASGAVPGTATM